MPLIVANVETVRQVGETTRVTRSSRLLVNEIVTTLLPLTPISLPSGSAASIPIGRT